MTFLTLLVYRTLIWCHTCVLQSGFQSFLGFRKICKDLGLILEVSNVWSRGYQSRKFEIVVNENWSVV